jgi:tetratricopeptide (TPR) repeat protein
VSQVRKDILNGWKEIGGYVCRDVRTVERWEKQRGLPVRRVPGEGRSTVYALIPELDEWLEKSKSDGAEVAVDGLPSDAGVPRSPTLFDWVDAAAVAPLAVESLSATDVTAPSAVAAVDSAPTAAPVRDTRAWFRPSHRKLVVRGAVAAAVGLVCLVASPLVRSHANPSVEASKYSLDKRDASAVPYRSQVAGVDALYLRGMYLFEQRTPQSLERSLDDFSSAIARDPNYAPAYAGLANTYTLLREYSVMPDAEAYPKARAAAEHAVALDPRLPQAHASLGFIDFFWAWDGKAAEREFQTALTLDPSSVLARHWYGSMLMHQGRFSEAIGQLDLAQRLEPTSAAVLSTRALALGLNGHRGEAIDMLQDLVNATPGVSSPHAMLMILSRAEPREPSLYLDEMRKTAELRHSDEMLQEVNAAEPAYRSGGESAMWASILATEKRLHPAASGKTYMMAEAEASLGHSDAVFADLNDLAQRRDPAVIGFTVDPSIMPLRGDPRYRRLADSIGLPPVVH